jgi:transcriptional regulator with GAF, ATPase, and Fis domain
VAQAKLLRVLHEHEFQRLGGTRVVGADVHVLAATNRDLHEAVAQGVYRAARTLGISRTQLYGRLRKYGFSQATI